MAIYYIRNSNCYDTWLLLDSLNNFVSADPGEETKTANSLK